MVALILVNKRLGGADLDMGRRRGIKAMSVCAQRPLITNGGHAVGMLFMEVRHSRVLAVYSEAPLSPKKKKKKNRTVPNLLDFVSRSIEGASQAGGRAL